MQFLRKAVLILVVLAVAFGGAMMLASESGEVVVLTTRDRDGSAHETRLWVVESQGALWLRAGVPSSRWLARLRAEPQVRVVRNGFAETYRAVPHESPADRDRINALMAEKYGWAEWLIGATRDGRKSVAVRLESVGE